MEEIMVNKAIILCVSCKGWSFPKHVLMETDAINNEKIDDIANRAFEKYKNSKNNDDLYLLDYVYYGDIEIVS